MRTSSPFSSGCSASGSSNPWKRAERMRKRCWSTPWKWLTRMRKNSPAISWRMWNAPGKNGSRKKENFPKTMLLAASAQIQKKSAKSRRKWSRRNRHGWMKSQVRVVQIRLVQCRKVQIRIVPTRNMKVKRQSAERPRRQPTGFRQFSQNLSILSRGSVIN